MQRRLVLSDHSVAVPRAMNVRTRRQLLELGSRCRLALMSVFKKLFAADRTSTPSQPPRRFPFNKADMQSSRLDPRLRAMQPLLEELMALRAYLHALRAASLSHAASPSAMASDAISQPGQGRPSFWLYITNCRSCAIATHPPPSRDSLVQAGWTKGSKLKN